MGESRRQMGTTLGGMLALGVSMALVPLRDHTSNVNIALALVLVVIGAAGIGGASTGLWTALVAAASFDFFFTEPYLSLKIADARDLQTTLLLLVVGLVVGQIAARSERVRHRRRNNIAELTRLHRVSDLVADGDSFDDLVVAVASDLVDILQLGDCYFERPPFLAVLPELSPSGAIVGPVHWRGVNGLPLPRDGTGVPLVAGRQLVGRFVLIPTPGIVTSLEQRLIATALVGQLRIRLTPAA